ncbi:DUF1778 domain-containing protein [Synechococcus sp. PCC 7336]|uniref:type II toxin-antitoxin system TacA family antitoxin n=1 Tax=Synechococcus sp. PCC 7336 TaxID=195250 RepID=UPI000345E6FA|nr:DUF1778 domain-containing protein [Synechococcus sp. PCC 7336]
MQFGFSLARAIALWLRGVGAIAAIGFDFVDCRKDEGRSMEFQTLEGTWEEILTRADELAGRRVRLTVLPEIDGDKAVKDTDDTEALMLDKTLEGLVGVVNSGESDLSSRTGEALVDRIALQERTAFSLSDKAWQAFTEAIDRPPADNPELVRLLHSRSPWE